MIDQQRLDRLVDGELSEQERVDLLRELDGQPTGWRQCALSFIESQLWQHELTRDHAPDPSQVSAATERPDVRPMRYVGWLVTAAAVMLAFTFGQRWDSDSLPRIQRNQVAEQTPTANAALRPADTSTQQWYAGQTLPDDVERMLREMGADVRQRQGWVVQNSEGQPTMVPYRDVELVPVRGPAY